MFVVRPRFVVVLSIASFVVACAGGGGEGAQSDAAIDTTTSDAPAADSARTDTTTPSDTHPSTDAPTDTLVEDTADATPPPDTALPTLDLKDCTLYDNPTGL